jgi:hypothetical protein
MKNDRTGILIVRLWLEDDSLSGLRARITRTVDTLDPEHDVTTAATSEGICAVVQAWVETFVNTN